MRRQPSKGQIRPKISTMPRQQSEAAAMLDTYKLVVEKKRLQQELQNLEQRREQIHDRLAVLESQIANLEQKTQQLRASEEQQVAVQSNDRFNDKVLQHFETLLLDY